MKTEEIQLRLLNSPADFVYVAQIAFLFIGKRISWGKICVLLQKITLLTDEYIKAHSWL